MQIDLLRRWARLSCDTTNAVVQNRFIGGGGHCFVLGNIWSDSFRSLAIGRIVHSEKMRLDNAVYLTKVHTKFW